MSEEKPQGHAPLVQQKGEKVEELPRVSEGDRLIQTEPHPEVATDSATLAADKKDEDTSAGWRGRFRQRNRRTNSPPPDPSVENVRR